MQRGAGQCKQRRKHSSRARQRQSAPRLIQQPQRVDTPAKMRGADMSAMLQQRATLFVDIRALLMRILCCSVQAVCAASLQRSR